MQRADSKHLQNTSIKGEKRVPSTSQEPIHAKQECDMSNRHKRLGGSTDTSFICVIIHLCYSASALMDF